MEYKIATLALNWLETQMFRKDIGKEYLEAVRTTFEAILRLRAFF